MTLFLSLSLFSVDAEILCKETGHCLSSLCATLMAKVVGHVDALVEDWFHGVSQEAMKLTPCHSVSQRLRTTLAGDYRCQPFFKLITGGDFFSIPHRGKTKERKLEYSFGNWKGEQMNYDIHVGTVKCTLYMYMAVRFLVPASCMCLYLEIQPSSTTCHTERDTLPYAQHSTSKLLMTMHYLSCLLYWSHECKAQTDVNFQSLSPRCTKYVPTCILQLQMSRPM